MDARLARWAKAAASIDYVQFCMAEEAVNERQHDTWKDYTYPETYIHQERAGKHPSTFKGFIEGLSWEMRQMGADCSAGDLLTLMDIYEACKGLGLGAEEMAVISVRILRTLWRHLGTKPEEFAREVGNAASVKAQFGTYYLPSFDEPGKIKYTVEFAKRPDGKIQMLGFTSFRDGTPHRNYFADEGEFHHFLKRTRAAAIERPWTQK